MKSTFFILGILIQLILRNTYKNQKIRYQSVHLFITFLIWLGSFLWSSRKEFSMKSIFEETGGTYSDINGYLIPNLTISDSPPPWQMGPHTEALS